MRQRSAEVWASPPATPQKYWGPRLTVGACRYEGVVGDHVGAAALLVHALKQLQRQVSAPRLLRRADTATRGGGEGGAATRGGVSARRGRQRLAAPGMAASRLCTPGAARAQVPAPLSAAENITLRTQHARYLARLPQPPIHAPPAFTSENPSPGHLMRELYVMTLRSQPRATMSAKMPIACATLPCRGPGHRRSARGWDASASRHAWRTLGRGRAPLRRERAYRRCCGTPWLRPLGWGGGGGLCRAPLLLSPSALSVCSSHCTPSKNPARKSRRPQPAPPTRATTHLLAVCADEGGVRGGRGLHPGPHHALVDGEPLLRAAALVAGRDDGVVGAHLGLDALGMQGAAAKTGG
jgi:hypothetical protein